MFPVAPGLSLWQRIPDMSKIVCRVIDSREAGLKLHRLAPLLLVPAPLAPALSAETTVDTQVIEEVTVIGVTPLDAGAHVPGASRSATAAEIERSNATDFASFANRRFGSAWLNETQGNPLQADLNFRGFTASPLLGTPQGLSVYLDGVRLNQPFADVVSWDLVPLDALQSATMLPGANPLFGLNSLGGAAVLKTKDGWTAPGSQLGAKFGAWNRRIYDLQTGGSTGQEGWAWYANAHRFEEDGWRDFSPSEANQALLKGSWRDSDTELSALVAGADTDLNGNGLQEMQLLEARRASVYTHPDETANRSLLGNFTLRQKLGDRASFAANAWYRNIRTRTFNGDINEDSLEENIYQPSVAERTALARGGYTGFPLAGETAANAPFPRWRCIANVLLNSEPNEKCNGLANRGALSQHEFGTNLQADVELPLAGRDNDLTFGAGLVRSRVHFRQSSQYGYLTADRGVMPVDGPGAFADGSQDSENAFDARVDFGGRTTTWSLYASDSLALTPALRATLAARFDVTDVSN
ncbi:TonB-dependent receptor, partial [bacterium]